MDSPLSTLFLEYRLAALYEVLARYNGQEQDKSTESRVVSPSPDKKDSFADIIKRASQKYNVDEDLIRAVIGQESSFNPQAVSRCGACGLMQLMPETARSLGVKDVFDPEENIMAGVKYLRDKLNEFGGNVSCALAAYNAGSAAVRKYGGIPPYKEKKAYVARILNTLDRTV